MHLKRLFWCSGSPGNFLLLAGTLLLYLLCEVGFFYIPDCDSSSTSNINEFQLFGPGWCWPQSSSLL